MAFFKNKFTDQKNTCVCVGGGGVVDILCLLKKVLPTLTQIQHTNVSFIGFSVSVLIEVCFLDWKTFFSIEENNLHGSQIVSTRQLLLPYPYIPSVSIRVFVPIIFLCFWLHKKGHPHEMFRFPSPSTRKVGLVSWRKNLKIEKLISK